jgi:hypothetical protein
MGFEARSALARGRRPKGGGHFLGAYRKACTQSPSARDAVRSLEVSWQPYASLSAFVDMFKHDLVKTLLDVGPLLGLVLVDMVLLERRQAQGEEPAVTGQGVGQDHAGLSGRILGREVWQAGEQN